LKHKKTPGGKSKSLEPSHEVVLENPRHKSSRKTKARCLVAILRVGNDDIKVSKSPISVNGKIA
jgi:hypothetical protein